MKITNIVVILSFSFLIFCCKKSPTESETKPFTNTLWTLESFVISSETIRPPEDQVYNILFSSDSTFTGQCDCNEIGGKYRIVENNQIKIISIGTTKIYCGENSKSDDYTSAISESQSFDVNDSKMFLSYGTEDSKMTFITK